MATFSLRSTKLGYHEWERATGGISHFALRTDTKFHYKFKNFFHPFVGELITKLNRGGLTGLLAGQLDPQLRQSFFDELYDALQSEVVSVTYDFKELDVSADGPYANYNWELFFHIPLTVAVHLSKTQRFAEAQRWFHYIFDPTSNDTSVPAPARFWKFLAFRKGGTILQIDQLLKLLSKPEADLTDEEREARTNLINGYNAILDKPFMPHAVARTRHLAYQYYVVMKYLDNLIAWGDNLFQQDTIESINEATQLYVLAANLLGERPQRIPPRAAARPMTFAQLNAAGGPDPLGNLLVEMEGQFPFNLAGFDTAGGEGADGSGPLLGVGRALYFCVPRNDKLLRYWDTVADRLFKIRHCMNIAGVVRPLALFDPPLDPGMLVKAAAAGIDISGVVAGLSQPVGPVRSMTLIQKSLELCGEVRSLGGALLSALEKGDGERLGLIRQSHEVKVQQLAQEVRFLQWKSAQESTKSLLTSRATALERYNYYRRLLGAPTDQNVPETITLDRRELNEENFEEAFNALVGQYDKAVKLLAFPNLRLAGDTSPTQQSGAAGPGRLFLNTNEDAELNSHLPTARNARITASVADTLASVLTFIPEFNINLHFWGMGGSSNVFGGSKLSDASKIAAEIARTIAGWEQDQAGMAARTAGHERRADDWLLQFNLAARELMQLGRQVLTSLIAEQVAHREYLNVQQQVRNAQEVDEYLRSKFTNAELYLWMQGEVSRLYYEYYRFAFDTARKAERTMKHELMRPELDAQDFVKFNYWDGGRKGLLAGEALHLDVKRMEMAYHDHNKREFELTRHVSLRQLSPLALLTLKVTGECQVTIPEWLYDRDCPGHYMRRIKTVALSLPSVVGPYTSVNCTLSLLRSTVRKSPIASGDYPRMGAEDDRFIDYVGAVQSVVTSTGNNDGGLFETNLRDERFLPFEGAGAESTWKLELPKNHRTFDYSTISDVILHVRYTARQGVNPTEVKTALDDLFADASKSNLALLFSLRHDFPTEWSAFVNAAAGPFTVRLRKDYFPYMTAGKTVVIDGLELYAQNGAQLAKRTLPVPAGLADDLNGPTHASDLSITADAAVLKRNADAQVFLIVRYSF